MGLLRDKLDLRAGLEDHDRAARGGGPRRIAHSPGRPRGSDRFPGPRRGPKRKRR